MDWWHQTMETLWNWVYQRSQAQWIRRISEGPDKNKSPEVHENYTMMEQGKPCKKRTMFAPKPKVYHSDGSQPYYPTDLSYTDSDVSAIPGNTTFNQELWKKKWKKAKEQAEAKRK